MKIATFGARHHAGQVVRIDEALRALGHELIDDATVADLVYSNNAWYEDLIDLKQRGRIAGKLIFNVLDCAPHIADFPIAKLAEQLKHADAVTTISKTVQTDLKTRTGIDSTVIYNPIKPIYETHYQRYSYRYMFVGRVNDAAKRCHLGARALSILGVAGQDVVTVGDEPPHYGGDWFGIADDEQLNDLYNSVDFVLFPSVTEGIGLPPIEAVFAGAIPVICNDCPAMMEWFGDIKEYRQIEPTGPSIAAFLVKMQNDEARIKLREKLNVLLSSLRDKFTPKRVAERILEVYSNL